MQDVEWNKFAASETLSELVWSQRDGLCLKSFDRSKSDKKPIILWNIWQDSVPLSPSRNVESNNIDDKQIAERNFVVSCSNLYVDKEVAQRNFPSNKDTENEIIGTSHKQITQNSLKMEEDNNGGDSPSHKSQINENLVDNEEIEVCSAVNFLEASMVDKTLGHNVEAGLRIEEHVIEKKKEKKLLSLNTIEFSGENDLHIINRVDTVQNEKRVLRGRSVPVENSVMKTNRSKYQKNAVSDGNLKRKTANGRDDSQKSEESCNSVGFLSKGKRKCEFFQDNLMEESKRIKTRTRGISGSRLDSSFMNWIINVAKGKTSKPNQEQAPLSIELEPGGHSNQEHGSGSNLQKPKARNNNGFQNVFKSLYTSSVFSKSRLVTDESKECVFRDEVNLGESFGDLDKAPDECIPLSQIDSAAINAEANLEENKAACNLKSASETQNPKHAGDGGKNKSDLINSLWIRRLTTQNDSSSISNIVNALPRINSIDTSYKETQIIASKNETCNATEGIYEHNDQTHKQEGIAFMFPRKLDALKSLVPAGSKDHGTCFLCGKRRDFSYCSNVNEVGHGCSKRYDYSYNEGVEDINHILPVTSVRCIQSNPLDFSSFIGSSRLEKNVCQRVGQKPINKDKIDYLEEKFDHTQGVHYHSSKTIFEGDREVHLANEKDPIPSRSHDSTGTEKPQTNSDKKGLIFHQFLPVTVNDQPQVGDFRKEIFDAVRRLQVSRSDMLKLMNSEVLLSHIEGFFLRLRLGKWETGLGGTGYHVACITGNSIQDGQNGLYVDVGGINFPVGNQYVSNQEFSEEELMTWWCRSRILGGKIPSKDDLDFKVNMRIKLGF